MKSFLNESTIHQVSRKSSAVFFIRNRTVTQTHPVSSPLTPPRLLFPYLYPPLVLMLSPIKAIN